ncbi:unnamed protein product, partial [marine sediment metagenome]
NLMAHGAPDHTRLAESGFAHYVDRVVPRPGGALVATPAWEEALNVDIQGVFGYMWAWSDTYLFEVRITIDGVIVFHHTINTLRGGGFWNASSSWDKMGCTMFNEVIGDEGFGMFYDEKWGLYIHHNITIHCRRAGALGTQASWTIYYKELI